MYNLMNLNDYEFEILCKDIMESKLNIPLLRFAKGPDGGIDLCDSTGLQYIIQVKHYFKSSFSKLMTSLKKEVEKIQKKNPANYYVCCSLELTPNQRNEIFLLFSKYMKDKSYIIDKTDIDDFLSNSINNSILEKNYKLWLCSTNVLHMIQNQNVFIDCTEILSEIERYTKLFVSTKSYFECRKKLIEKNIIIIIGAPGVGKSTVSKMLLLFFASKNYTVRYVTDNNIKDIKNILSREPAKKEIILLDDFLGQHYLKLNEKQPNELKTLISFVERNPNKKIIMNSRITIINEAYSSSLAFADLFDCYEKENYLIDLDKMSYLEKAQILYNHLYFNGLPIEYLLNIKNNKNYRLIIEHKNYNPRIIEFISKPKNYINIPSKEFTKFILLKLNNPNSVWEDEYRNRLQEYDRVLMNTLYSLTNDRIEINILEKAFNKRLLNVTNNTTLNIFEEVINRLNNSLIKIIVDNKNRYISVINPSVNDFLREKICKNPNEQIIIINNAAYIEQIFKFKQNKELISVLIYNNYINTLDSVQNITSFYYFELLLFYQIKNLEIKQFVQNAFEQLCNSPWVWFKDSLIIRLIEKEYIEFYKLMDIMLNNLDSMLCEFSFDNLCTFYQWINSQKIIFNKNQSEIIVDCFINLIQYNVLESIKENIQEIVASNITSSNCTIEMHDGGTIDDLITLYVDEYYNCIENEVVQNINFRVKEYIGTLPLDLDDNRIDYNYILDNVDIDKSIMSYVNSEYGDSLVDSQYETFNKEYNDWKIIDEMFS